MCDGNVGKDRHYHRTGLGPALDFATMLQRCGQPRHADGEARRRDRLAAKARNQSVVTPASGNRAEAHWPAGLVLNVERQIYLVDRAGVVFEAADDCCIDNDPRRPFRIGPICG